jgi:hypothetical protein
VIAPACRDPAGVDNESGAFTPAGVHDADLSADNVGVWRPAPDHRALARGDCPSEETRVMSRFLKLAVAMPALVAALAITPAVSAKSAPTSTCDGQTATIVGTSAADALVGTSGRDVIVGLGGNDKIQGGGGRDVICGGSGDDTLAGGPGDDRLSGGSGDDTIAGGLGDDTLAGGTGDDRLNGGRGSDSEDGGRGTDTITDGTHHGGGGGTHILAR